MIKGFKEFILRGNVVDLAVGIVVGAAFGAVVTSFVNDVLMAFIGAVVGKPSFNDLSFTVGDGIIYYGRSTGWVDAARGMFVVVVPMNMLAERRARGQETDVEPTNEERMVALLEQIAQQQR